MSATASSPVRISVLVATQRSGLDDEAVPARHQKRQERKVELGILHQRHEQMAFQMMNPQRGLAPGQSQRPSDYRATSKVIFLILHPMQTFNSESTSLTPMIRRVSMAAI